MSSLKLSRRLLCSVRFVFVSTFNLQRGRAFVVGITNLSKQAVCVIRLTKLSPSFLITLYSKKYSITLISALFLDFLSLEDETDGLSRNVGMELPLYAVQYPRRPQTWSTSRRKPKIRQSNNIVLACPSRCVDDLWARRSGFKPRAILRGSVAHKATLDHVSSKCFSFDVNTSLTLKSLN